MIFTGKLEFAWSHIWVCITLTGSCKKEGSSCKVYKFAFSHPFPSSSSQEASWEIFPISSSVKATSSSSAIISSSPSSWTSLVVTVGVKFYPSITFLVGLLVVLLSANHTVFLPIAGPLIVTVCGVIVNAFTVSWEGEEFVLVTVAGYSFLIVDYSAWLFISPSG